MAACRAEGADTVTVIDSGIGKRPTPSNVADATHSRATTPGDLPCRPGPPLKIDLQALMDLGLLASPPNVERQAYEYRTVKYALGTMRARPDTLARERSHLIAITSALPGDGKTVTSINLALSYAGEANQGVILVDADLAKCHLTQALNASAYPGLVNLVADETLQLGDVLLKTSIPNLYFLAAGTPRTDSHELLGTARGMNVITRLAGANNGRAVVFDTSPLLLTNESSLLAAQVGRIVLVVRAAHTLQDAVIDARSRIPPAVPVSVVLTAWEPLGLAEKDYYNRYEDYYARK